MSEDNKNGVNLVEVYREVGETKILITNLSEQLKTFIDKTQIELEKINQLDQEQNKSLDLHIAGVQTLQKMYIEHKSASDTQIQLLTESIKIQKQDLELRMTKVEKPYEIVKYIGKAIVWVATVGAGLATIIKWVQM